MFWIFLYSHKLGAKIAQDKNCLKRIDSRFKASNMSASIN